MASDQRASGVEIVRELHQAYNERDRDALLARLGEDVRWNVEGDSPFAGSYDSRDAAWKGYFEPLWASPARIEDQDVVEHGEHVVAFAQQVHNFGDGPQRWPTVEVLTLRDGLVVERQGFTSGQAGLDALFTRGCAADFEG